MVEVEWSNQTLAGPGRLLVFEGADGCGKTTQIERLCRRLMDRGRDVVVAKQPTDWYRNDPFVRAYLDQGGSSEQARSMALFAAADRLRHCMEVIQPALERGAAVICDRYVFSSLVYFEVRGVSTSFVAKINAGIPKPHVGIFFYVPADRLFSRLLARDGVLRKHEERSLEIIDRIQTGYTQLSNFLTRIDGCKSPDAVEAEVLEIVDAAMAE